MRTYIAYAEVYSFMWRYIAYAGGIDWRYMICIYNKGGTLMYVPYA